MSAYTWVRLRRHAGDVDLRYFGPVHMAIPSSLLNIYVCIVVKQVGLLPHGVHYCIDVQAAPRDARVAKGLGALRLEVDHAWNKCRSVNAAPYRSCRAQDKWNGVDPRGQNSCLRRRCSKVHARTLLARSPHNRTQSFRCFDAVGDRLGLMFRYPCSCYTVTACVWFLADAYV